MSAYHDCEFCTAAHSAIAKGVKADDLVLQAIAQGEVIADSKINVLVNTVKKVAETRGWIAEADLQAFFDAGYFKKHYLELILVVSIKTISNYINHQTQPEINEQFF